MVKNYRYVEKIDTLDDGSSSLLLREGKQAIIEIVKADEKFQAAIYRLAFGKELAKEEKERKHIFVELGKHTAYNDCLKEAIGWVDEHPGAFESDEVWDLDKK